jgi:hypothetical protein
MPAARERSLIECRHCDAERREAEAIQGRRIFPLDRFVRLVELGVLAMTLRSSTCGSRC